MNTVTVVKFSYLNYDPYELLIFFFYIDIIDDDNDN